jgi:hypothetical protein
MFGLTDSLIHAFLFSAPYAPTSNAIKKGHFGCIPVGTKGWIVKKWGRKYFTIDEDENQGELGLSPFILYLYKKIGSVKGCC